MQHLAVPFARRRGKEQEMRHLWLIASLALLLGASLVRAEPASKPMVLYVAPVGSDAWSGRTPKANKQKTDGPFATLERARAEF
ncbi:MAG: hypothetical protein COZ05_06275 [Armatimonadetes bacterium CG_4_10_14_3_um_filter_59_10]|nr:MAG: hypothetical protein COZ05_06275 [Armatimonadetes bacterium CG_4_10_14_3_um_filter_59_10]